MKTHFVFNLHFCALDVNTFLRRNKIDVMSVKMENELCFFKWDNPGLFLFIFVLLLQFQYKLKKA